MNFDALTDSDIDALVNLSKHVTNPRVQWQNKPGHRQRNFKAEGGDHTFEIYLRQSTSSEDDFSCGLKVIKPDGMPLTLLRYNGGGHLHGAIRFECHIHKATARAMAAGRKPESHAEQTNRYRSLEGALACLVGDAAVTGLPNATHDEPDLFE